MIIELNHLILILLSVIWFLLKKNKPNNFLNERLIGGQFLLDLEKYYIFNKFIVFFMAFLYFFFNSIAFIILRYQVLGTPILVDFSINKDNILYLIQFGVVILNINLYLKILNMVFYSYIIKLHFYFCQFSWYVSITDFQRENEMIFSNIIDVIEPTFNIKQKNLRYILFKISLYISRFLSYIPSFLVLFSLIFDLYKGCLFYVFYMLLLYFISNLIKRIRRFIYVKDILYDNTICKYFYKNTLEYAKIRKFLQENPNISCDDIIKLGEETAAIIYLRAELINYIKHDFHVYYTLDPDRIQADNLLNSRAKRLNILLLLVLANYYYFCNLGKYQIILCEKFQLDFIYISIILFILCCICDIKILSNNGIEYNENKKYSYLFMFLFISQTIIILYIMLKNKITLFPDEFILDWNYIKIIENYSIDEKMQYLEKYLNNFVYCQYENNLELWLNIKTTLIQNTPITEQITLKDIRNIISSQISI